MEIEKELLHWAHQNEVRVKWGTIIENDRVVGVYKARSDHWRWIYNSKNWAVGYTISEAIRALREKIGGAE